MFVDEQDQDDWVEWFVSLSEVEGFADQFEDDDEAEDFLASYIADVEGMDFEDARAFLHVIAKASWS